ncbi:putative bifunctional diguanylate cyclase/phosphodiesterase [Arthrobacter sp. HLT1-21]
MNPAASLPPNAPHLTPTTLGDLGFEALVLPGSTPSSEIEAAFRSDRGLRAVVVDVEGNQFVLTRDQVDDQMTGRLGFGRALNTRATAAALLPRASFSLPPSLDLRAAAAALLERPEEYRYHDLLVTATVPRIVPVSEVFEALSHVFRHAAHHDPLTGLANRLCLDELGPTLLTGHDPLRIAALYVDLDDFKVVNDTFGHRAGDSVLAAFAGRLQASTTPSATVVRLGGDEFAVLLQDVGEIEARDVAHRILQSFSAPFSYDGHDLRLSATVGLAMGSDADGLDPETRLEYLLRHADTAMLQAKREGKRQLGRIDPSQPATRFARQALIRRRLPHALNNKEFSLHYQPLMDVLTGSCHAVEALLRWRDPDLCAVSPDQFIPIAEHTGEIHAIGRWVIDQACAQARLWADSGTPRAISVNVLPLQLAAGSLITDLNESVRRHGIPPTLLNIEITESAPIADIPSAAAQLRTLIDSGIGVALDDYGTAYSSLALLRELPLTGLKLDKSLIDTIDTDPISAILVAGVITPARAIGLRTTAEGVEREAQLDVLRELGCDTAQGYLISRPLPAADLDAVGHFGGSFHVLTRSA